MKQFAGRTALITGSASGIGQALALELARNGMHLLLADRDEAGLAATAADCSKCGVDVAMHICDLSRPEEVDRLAERALEFRDGVDLLINNAGIAYYGPTHAMTDEQWDRIMAVNLLAPVQLTRRLLPHLLERDDAHVVNMCSISGIVAGGRFNAYHTTKFGLVGFTAALRAEYTRKGLGVTAICPGPSRTNLYSSCEIHGRSCAPQPPAWICASPERIARVTLRAIRKNRGRQLVSPLAYLLDNLQRFSPWLIDFMNTFSRKRLPWARSKAKAKPALRISPGEATGSVSSRRAA